MARLFAANELKIPQSARTVTHLAGLRSVLVLFLFRSPSDMNDPRNHAKRAKDPVPLRVISWIVLLAPRFHL